MHIDELDITNMEEAIDEIVPLFLRLKQHEQQAHFTYFSLSRPFTFI